jgi:hypothetical protein
MRTFRVRRTVNVVEITVDVADRAPMKTQLPITTEEPIVADGEHRVLQFRPRTLAKSPYRRDDSSDQHVEFGRQAANDLSRYERDRQPPDDFHHRMLANTAAFALTVALIAVGIWLAMSISEMRNTQDCVLMGRTDCARISTTQPSPHPLP